MRDTVKTLLEGNAPIMALLTGGVYAAKEISRSDEVTAAAFDANGELQPCVLVKLPGEETQEPADILGAQALDLYFYERNSYTAIDAALPLVRAILHKQKIGTSADKVFQVLHRRDVTDIDDPALRANLHIAGYEIMRNRG